MPTCSTGMPKMRTKLFSAREHAHTSGSITTGNRLNQAFFLKEMSGGDALRALTPTGSLIDAYPMADGRLIHENGSIVIIRKILIKIETPSGTIYYLSHFYDS